MHERNETISRLDSPPNAMIEGYGRDIYSARVVHTTSSFEECAPQRKLQMHFSGIEWGFNDHLKTSTDKASPKADKEVVGWGEPGQLPKTSPESDSRTRLLIPTPESDS